MNHTTLEKKASTKNGIGRMVFSLLVLLLDIWFLISLFTSLNRYAVWIDGATRLSALILVLAIYGRNQTSSMKTPLDHPDPAVPHSGSGPVSHCGP